MSLSSAKPSAFSTPQRHCHLLLLLYLPEASVTFETLSEMNRVERAITRQDIAEVAAEIQRYHRLALYQDTEGAYQISGTELDQRLCLVHWLRRALRLAPEFVQRHFTPQLKLQLRKQQIDKALYNEQDLQALVQNCSQRLSRQFTERDRHFLQLFMQHSLCRQARTAFSAPQLAWLAARMEYQVAEEALRHWHKQRKIVSDSSEIALFSLLLRQMSLPDPCNLRHDYEYQLLAAVRQMIDRFQGLSGMRFSNEQGLCEQLYTHLSQALERTLFGLGIYQSPDEEVARLYPKLLRTTQAAMTEFEQQYALTFSADEMGLIAIIFGAWLMQESVLQEKQVLLLTGEDPELERQIEQQLRELTLLPLNIKYLDVAEFQRSSAPKGIALVITPYATSLPLYSPPLIHAELPLQEHQQHCIRQLLES